MASGRMKGLLRPLDEELDEDEEAFKEEFDKEWRFPDEDEALGDPTVPLRLDDVDMFMELLLRWSEL